MQRYKKQKPKTVIKNTDRKPNKEQTGILLTEKSAKGTPGDQEAGTR